MFSYHFLLYYTDTAAAVFPVLNLDFATGGDEMLTLPGQVMVNSDEVYRKTVGGKLPFVEILEQIKLNLDTGNADAAVPV